MSRSPDNGDLVGRLEAAIADIRSGKMVILVDDEDRENEGDLVVAAERVTPEAISFMARFGRGLICLALTGAQVDRLELPLMTLPGRRGPRLGTAFTVSIEARHGVSTGISAHDRAHTIRVAVAPDARPYDIVTPGHVFPLRARSGGVLVRAGQTEGSVDLARLAGLVPAGVICEVMNDDGSMARVPDLVPFAARHGLKMISVKQLIAYRHHHERLINRVVETTIPTPQGPFRGICYT
jgi:3,4-dihydroxy 2-butanone 4-phosphate synthase/GTP cyclohydrolase II